MALERNIAVKKVILVTGSSSGFGRAIADRLACTPSNRLYGASRTDPLPHIWQHLTMDVTDDRSVTDAVGEILEREGRIDVLIHCAGDGLTGPIETTSVAEAQRQFDTNYFGALRVIQALLPGMREQRSGRLVMIGSIAGLIGLPFQGHMSASKFALDGMMEALRMEIAPFGVEACIVHPGDYNTAFSLNRNYPERARRKDAYSPRFGRAVQVYYEAERKGGSPEDFALKLELLLSRSSLPAKSVIGLPIEHVGVWAKALLPPKAFETLFRMAYAP